jgi:uncharacterized protein YfaP (DUF2135 family)
MTWHNLPLDLDLHAIEVQTSKASKVRNAGCHIFYQQKKCGNSAQLDVDNRKV